MGPERKDSGWSGPVGTCSPFLCRMSTGCRYRTAPNGRLQGRNRGCCCAVYRSSVPEVGMYLLYAIQGKRYKAVTTRTSPLLSAPPIFKAKHRQPPPPRHPPSFCNHLERPCLVVIWHFELDPLLHSSCVQYDPAVFPDLVAWLASFASSASTSPSSSSSSSASLCVL